ncbi:MAG TPA: hypothetical protein PLL42_00075 [Bacilli bacterium]|nr:hypothetical protein [Bacilli bacterium]
MKTRVRNQFLKILIGGLFAVFAISFTHFSDFNAHDVKGEEAELVDCAYYFDESNGYTSIYEIVSGLNSSTLQSGTHKTWGTVTKYYLDSSQNKNFYMQSTDKNGNTAGIMIYRSSISVTEGNVLTIEGFPTLYNNLPEFEDPSSIEVDYAANSSPIETLVTSESFWQNGTDRNSSQFLSAQSLGTRKISIQNIALSSIYSTTATATIGSTNVVLYYAYLSNSSEIYNALYSLSAQTVNLTGYLHCFFNGYEAKMQLLIRSTSDIFAGGVDYSLTIDASNYTSIGTYSTGNYDEKSISGFIFEHYRAIAPINSNQEFIILLPYVNQSGDGSAPGALYNTTAINDIFNIAITYHTESTYGAKPVLSYGANPLCETQNELNLSTVATTVSLAMSDVDFFKVETSETRLFIHSLEIDYASEGPAPAFSYLSSGANGVRINPITYSGELTNGASASVPISISQSGAHYTVQTTKTYTYYTYEHFIANPQLVAQAAYTEPEDVAAFYTIFGTYPSNYVFRNNYSSAYSLFGDATRCVSVYSRTDGYATSVPYQADYSGYPLYYECDIAFDSSYSSNNRGVGRVVCWDYGFDQAKGAVGYDDSPVAVYSDDHYATFQEYLNAGSFGARFNAEMVRTGYVWGPAMTLLPY